MLLTGAQALPNGEDGYDEDPTCGLTFAQIPRDLTPQQATARIMEMALPRNRLGFEFLDGIVWRYQLTEPYDKVAAWLDNRMPVSKRLQLFSSLALLGAGDFREPEAQKFLSTLQEVRDLHDWKQVYGILGRLDDERFDQAVLAQLRQAIQSLPEGEEGEDYSSRVVRLNLDGLLREQEFRLSAVRETIVTTLDLPRAERLAQTADFYAEIDGSFSEYLVPWAAARLVRESWAKDPAQQTQRNPQPEKVEEVASALRDCLERASSPKVIDKADERLGVRLRLLRMIGYLGAKLSDEERLFMEKNIGHHIDLLD